MPITRINDFRAQAGQEAALRDALLSLLPGIAAAAGCISVRLLHDAQDATRFVVLEVWESVDAHRASLQGFDPDDFAHVMKLFARPPSGQYLAPHGP